MAALPPTNDFTDAIRTNIQMKATFAALRDFLSGLLGADGLPATALATLGALGANYAAKAAAYTVVLADRGKLLDATGTWTLSLPAAATAAAGFTVALRNSGGGTITIDPSGAELVNGAATFSVLSGQCVVLVCTGTAWLSAGSDAQQSNTDASVGRLMTVGAFGLGVSGGVNVADLDDVTTRVGFYRTISTAVGTFPAGMAKTGRLRVEIYNNTGIYQEWSPLAFNNLIFVRFYNGTTWSTWQRMYNSGNVLGTVSQTSGVPTGALFEPGANANGEYFKFADGRLICTRTMAASSAAATTWTYPAAFIAAPVLSGMAVATVLAAVVADAAPGTTSCTFSVRDKTDARRADSTMLAAVGRWF